MKLFVAGQALIRKAASDFSHQGFSSIVSLIRSCEFAFTNFEGAIHGNHACWPTKETFASAVNPDMLDNLEEMGFSILSLSNNHSFDLGPGGVLSTLEESAKRSFLTAGLGIDKAEAIRPGVKIINGVTVALHSVNCTGVKDASYCKALNSRPTAGIPARPGVNCIEITREHPDADVVFKEEDVVANLEAISRIQAELVILYIHHHTTGSTPEQVQPSYRDLCRRFVKAGAHVVVGHGTPVFQGVEIFDGKPIFYNLANFIFHTQSVELWHGRYGNRPWESFAGIIRFREDWTVEDIEIIPVVLGDPAWLLRADRDGRKTSFPTPASGRLGSHILDNLIKVSEPLGTSIFKSDKGRGVIAVSSESQTSGAGHASVPIL